MRKIEILIEESLYNAVVLDAYTSNSSLDNYLVKILERRHDSIKNLPEGVRKHVKRQAERKKISSHKYIIDILRTDKSKRERNRLKKANRNHEYRKRKALEALAPNDKR